MLLSRLHRSDTALTRESPITEAAAVGSGDNTVIATIALAAVAALVLKLSLLPLSNTDMTEYVLPWLEATREQGFAVLGDEITDYSPAYSYLLLIAAGLLDWVKPISAVKLISLAGDVVLASLAGLLAHALGAGRARTAVTAVVIFALPSVLINSSAWGQTDAIWASAILGAVLAMLRGRPAVAVLLYGLAVAYKPQAVFLGPILLAFLLARRQPGWLLLLPLPYLLLALPPLLMGRSFSSVFGVYFTVFGSLGEVSYDAPGLWSWRQLLGKTSNAEVMVGLALGVATGIVLTMLALRRGGRRLHDQAILHAAALSCALLPFVTPKMMGRYFYASEVMLAIAACLNPLLLPAAIASQIAALLAYEPFLLGLVNWRVPLAVLFNLLAIGLVSQVWLRAGFFQRSRQS
jgi:Gpi18-like mannosyltransferase